jgi:hypothetical protein
LEQIVPQPTFTNGVYGLEHVDVNGDGRLDIYVPNYGIAGDGFRDAVLLNLGTGNQLFTQVYYPEFPNGNKDFDTDHPVWADFDADGRIDIAVAQFAGPTFVLRNETANGVVKLVEKTPPEISSSPAMRLRAFDANGDGTQDLLIGHDTPGAGISMVIGNVFEQEPNETIAEAHTVKTFPAVVTGVILSGSDKDVFALPTRAYNEGTSIRLRPAAGVDLRLQLLDAAGNVVATSQSGGAGAWEQINAAPGTLARFARVELQGTLGSGIYRLDIDLL